MNLSESFDDPSLPLASYELQHQNQPPRTVQNLHNLKQHQNGNDVLQIQETPYSTIMFTGKPWSQSKEQEKQSQQPKLSQDFNQLHQTHGISLNHMPSSVIQPQLQVESADISTAPFEIEDKAVGNLNMTSTTINSSVSGLEIDSVQSQVFSSTSGLDVSQTPFYSLQTRQKQMRMQTQSQYSSKTLFQPSQSDDIHPLRSPVPTHLVRSAQFQGKQTPTSRNPRDSSSSFPLMVRCDLFFFEDFSYDIKITL